MVVIAGSDWLAKIPAFGRHVVTSTEASAGAVLIDTDKPSANAALVQVWNAGVDATSDAVVTVSSGVITVTDAGATTFDLTAGYAITWIAFED